MENKNDWKEIESYIKNKDMSRNSQYKIDINKEYNKIVNRSKRKINGKLILVIIILILIFSIFISIFKTYGKQQRISIIEQSLHANAEEIPIKVSWFANGLYSYKTAKLQNEEIHAVFVNYKNVFINDASSRLHKYYFENWKDEDKNKFAIDEHYEEGKYGFIKEKKWLLVYDTYIEVNNYEELAKATDIVIKYSNYVGKNIYLGSNIYIKYKDNIIRPIQASEMSDDLIRTNVNKRYNEITNK